MSNPGIYGTGMGYDAKGNIPITLNQKMAYRFKASTSSPLNGVRFTQRSGPGGYSAGTGGTMTVSVRADDGSGHPAATALSSLTFNPTAYAGATEIFDLKSFPSPATLTAGKIYYIVFTGSSATNYISVNMVWTRSAVTPRQPKFADADFGMMYTSGAWGALDANHTPVVDLVYANGTIDGQSYFEAMIEHYATISGTSNMARERFTVSGGDKTVGSVSVRLRRSVGTSPLRMTLETATGVAIESVTVPAASVPVVSAPGGTTSGAVWVTANFSSPRVLSNAATYNLRLSTTADTTYTTHPARAGTDKGYATSAFTGGSGQFTSNASTWTDLYAYSKEDLQFYFKLAAAAPTPTTTPAPTTTTPAPTTTTPAPTTTTPQVAPFWQSSQVPGGTVGVDYSFQYDATGTPKPTYALTARLLPPGLTLTPAGLLAGKPTTAGSFTFTVSAQNGVAPDAVRERTIVVSPAAIPTLQCPIVVSPTVGQTVVCTYR
jgi:hypothetical protein